MSEDIPDIEAFADAHADLHRQCGHVWTAWTGVGDLPNGTIVEERHCRRCRIYESRERPLPTPPESGSE